MAPSEDALTKLAEAMAEAMETASAAQAQANAEFQEALVEAVTTLKDGCPSQGPVAAMCEAMLKGARTQTLVMQTAMEAGTQVGDLYRQAAINGAKALFGLAQSQGDLPDPSTLPPGAVSGAAMQRISQALALSAQNLANSQQQANVMWQAATVQGINALMNTGNAVTK